MLWVMWGRMAFCGRVLLGLPASVPMPTRPIDNRPQVANLPHIRHSDYCFINAAAPAIPASLP